MSKKPSNLETLRLAIELLNRIPRTHAVGARQLRDELEALGMVRTMRTIERQLCELSDHFDIERNTDSVPYSYRWKKDADPINLAGMTPQQSLVLNLAQNQLTPLLPLSVRRAMNSFFEEAHDNLRPHTNAKRERAWLNKVRVVSTSQPLLPPKIKDSVFEAVSHALYMDEWLEIEYVNAEGKTIKNRVMPLGLAQQGVRLYLVCRFHGYENERSLAVHRLSKAKATGLPFDRPSEFDLKAYDDEGRFGVSLGPPIKLTMVISKTAGLHLLETPLSNDQQVKEKADDYEITATVVPTDVLKRWLRGFGKQLKSVKPAKLLD